MSEVRTFNVYCDESCHLEHDHIPVMAWGAVSCPAGEAKRIMLCRARVGVAEEAPDDLKVEAARNEVGSMGMPIVVQAIVRNARLFGDCLPELLDVLKELAGHGFAAGDGIAVGG